jgi:hypothetical protein
VQQSVPVNDQYGNRVYSIFFVDAQNGWLTTSGTQICRYTGTTNVDDDINSVNEFKLEQNYPNPFNPSTSIHYTIGSSQFVRLKVYNVLGDEIVTLVDENKSAGSYQVDFNASSLTSGVYFYQLKSGSHLETRKMILMK